MTINGPLDLAPWRDRIAAAVPEFRQVGLAADLVLAQESLRSTPQAFIAPVSDTPSAQAGAGNSVRSQSVNAVVAVVFAVANNRESATGSAAASDLQTLRRSVMDSLLGWIPPGADLGMQYSGGRLLAYQDSTVWWTDRYSTSYFVRKEFST